MKLSAVFRGFALLALLALSAVLAGCVSSGGYQGASPSVSSSPYDETSTPPGGRSVD